MIPLLLGSGLFIKGSVYFGGQTRCNRPQREQHRQSYPCLLSTRKQPSVPPLNPNNHHKAASNATLHHPLRLPPLLSPVYLHFYPPLTLLFVNLLTSILFSFFLYSSTCHAPLLPPSAFLSLPASLPSIWSQCYSNPDPHSVWGAL